MGYFKYGEKEIQHLKERDPLLGEKIDQIGMVQRETNPNIFSSLIESIIGQQISTKAAITVRARLVDLFGEISPEAIYKTNIEEIQACGISMRKAEYIKGSRSMDSLNVTYPFLRKTQYHKLQGPSN